MSQAVTVPANTGKKAVIYVFRLAVTGIKTVKAKAVKVTVTATARLLTRFISLTGDGNGFCGLLSAGGVDCWGNNTYGELGNGSIGGPDGVGDYDTPQAVIGIANAVSVTGDSSDLSYCAVLSNAGVDCWGENANGQLGNGTVGGPDGADGYDTPQSVVGISNAASVVSNSFNANCALLSSGGVDCWGRNDKGQLGNGTIGGPDGLGGYDTPQSVVGVADAVSLGTDTGTGGFCAVLSTGAVDCWGDNSFGQIGNGTIDGPDGGYTYDTAQVVSGITDAVSVSGDSNSSYCAVLSSGAVDCWGNNTSGELGDGSIGGPDGVGDYDTPQAVIGISNAVSVSSDGNRDYCAVLSTGGVYCWGRNVVGDLGNGVIGGPVGAPGGYDTPQAAIGINNAVSMSPSASEGYCADLSTGAVDCWGDNSAGDIGNGTTGGPDGANGYDTPQSVVGIADAVSLGTDGQASCAVLWTGYLGCWGGNPYGDLGNGVIGGPDGFGGYDTPQMVIP